MRLLGVIGAGSLMLAAACGGGSDGGGPGPTPQQTLDRISPSVTTLALSAGATSTITATALDTQGATIANPGTFTFESSAPTVAAVNAQGTVIALSAGGSTITISLTRNGISKTASVMVSVTGQLGLTATVAAGTASNTFQPQVVVIRTTGTVTWSFGALEHNVTFSGASPPGGNTAARVSNTTVSRTFPNAGDYPYDCNLHAGMTGTVFVR